MIYKNNKGQVIGELKDEIFRKKVSRKKHLMKILNAWGIDEAIVEKLKGQCAEIRIKDTDTGTIYHTTLDTFLEKSEVHDYVGKQRFLPLKHWNYDSMPNLR